MATHRERRNLTPFTAEKVLADGIAALRWAAARTRVRIDAETEAGPLWLLVRDFDGLADRLEGMDEAGWRRGDASFWVTGQDMAVLAEWRVPDDGESPYQDAANEVSPGERARAIGSLRAFLEWYLDDYMALDADARRQHNLTLGRRAGSPPPG